MSDNVNVIYYYDGTFEGFLNCVFTSVYEKERPIKILPESEYQPSLFVDKWIETDVEKAKRVYISIEKKMNKMAQNLVKYCFLTCLENKEMILFNFIFLGYNVGSKITLMLGDSIVCEVINSVKHLKNEAHKFKGFIRFIDINGVLVAQISPKNHVLPLIRHHFCNRYPSEAFIIHDKNHGEALMYQNYRWEIVELDDLKVGKADLHEEEISNMWKSYYNTIAIKERENEKCRMTLMPKRYWKDMLEVSDEIDFRLVDNFDDRLKLGS